MHSHQPALHLTRLGRLGKSVLVAGVSTLIALLSHVLAGGPVPELLGVLVPFGLAAIICLPLSGRLRSLPRLVPAVLLSQLAYHWLFVLGGSGSGSGTLVAVDGGAAVGHAGHAFILLGGIATPEAGGAMMWVAHGIAAIATIALIRRGETALLGLLRLVELIAMAILPALPAAAPLGTATPRPVAAEARAEAPILRQLAETVSRRGPPAGTAAFAY